jgi:assimilatory nitrate reductase catalytic subunit
MPEPFLEIHPTDDERLGLGSAALVEVESPYGKSILRAFVTDAVRPGEVFAPMHWTGETAPCARVDALVAPVVDPVSGQPESKATAVSVKPFTPKWHGFAVSRHAPNPVADYWAQAKTTNGFRLELASSEEPEDWLAAAQEVFGLEGAEVQSLSDLSKGVHRFAFFKDGELIAALFIAPQPIPLARDWLARQPGEAASGVLAGRDNSDQPDPGPMVCSCFSVGVNTIVEAIQSKGLTSVDDIGKALQAGTNCGSCRSELASILQAYQPQEVA